MSQQSDKLDDEAGGPDVRGLLGNILDHWEILANDIKSDPGMHNLNAAMREADKALSALAENER